MADACRFLATGQDASADGSHQEFKGRGGDLVELLLNAGESNRLCDRGVVEPNDGE